MQPVHSRSTQFRNTPLSLVRQLPYTYRRPRPRYDIIFRRGSRSLARPPASLSQQGAFVQGASACLCGEPAYEFSIEIQLAFNRNHAPPPPRLPRGFHLDCICSCGDNLFRFRFRAQRSGISFLLSRRLGKSFSFNCAECCGLFFFFTSRLFRRTLRNISRRRRSTFFFF